MSPGGISQIATRSGFIFAIQVAMRSKLSTRSVPLPKATFQLNTLSVELIVGELTFIWTDALVLAPALSVTVKRAV